MEKASLLGQWKGRNKPDGTPNAIGKAPEGVELPLSHSQQRLWFLQQLYPGNAFYNYSEKFRFVGDLKVDVLLQALDLVFANHDILRTTYFLKDGQPFMRVHPESGISFSQHDFEDCKEKKEAALQKIVDTDANYSFDLSETPVALVSVVGIKADEFVVLLTLHHIATDKWSMNLLKAEWAKYYQELSKGDFPDVKSPLVQYPDFAYWQRGRPIKQNQLDYWKVKLAGETPIIDLPTDFPRPKEATFAGLSSAFHHFSQQTSETILETCKRFGVTPYVFFLSVYYLFLYRYTGQKDILIGSPISSRDLKQLEDTIGFFNDTVVLRTELSPENTFLDLVSAVKKTTLEAFSNKDVPFEVLVRELEQERSLSINPFFQVMFLYYSVGETESFGENLQVDYEFYNPGVSKFDLTFDVAENNGKLSFAFEYSTELFTEATISRFQEHIALLVNGVVANPERPILEIEMLTSDEKKFLLAENLGSSEVFQEFTGIHQCIEKMAETQPDAIAVSFADNQLSYQELNTKANVLAYHILEETGGRNEVVGLCVVRSAEIMVGLLGILKAGCAYLPIDPAYPEERIDFVIKDADVKIVLTQTKLTSRFSALDIHTILVNDIDIGKEPARATMPVPHKSDLAYVIYTSGSTGKPKGVPITHGSILNSTAGRLDFYNENPKSFLLLSSISFDSSKAGIFWTLCTGGNLVVTENRIEQDMVKLADTIQRHSVTHTLLLPTLYRLVLEHADAVKLGSLTTITVAGEACPPSLGELHFATLPEVGLYNEYGPTEATVWCIAHKIEKDRPKGAIPLGRSVANAQIYLLDANMNLVPLGATGEIYIGGPGLSTGYLNRPELTAKAYFDNPFSSQLGTRIYKTGDVARYNSNGDLEFLGRSDQQIKIRGYRVELEEIAKAIGDVANTTQVVVLAEGKANTTKRIVAYVSADEIIAVDTLKTSLKKNIPDYMIPSSIVQVDTMPSLPNGKIDKTALKKLKRIGESETSDERQAPNTELEFKLHAIWQDVLNLEAIGVHDNFFALGGDSILSIQFIAKARKANINLTPNQIFDKQTIAGLAEYVSSKKATTEEWDYLVALRKEGIENPLFCIHAGGGHVFFYNVLTKYIGAHRPIYALQASGVYAGMEMHHSIESMATDYLQAIRSVQPSGPYNIMVYCFSVAVGHEMVIQLTRSGETANLIVMDTMTDPWKLDTGDRLLMRIKSFSKRLFASPIKTVRGMINERIIQMKLKMRQKMAKGDDKMLAELNANLAVICEKYSWRPHHEKVTVLLTEKPDAAVNKEVIGSWKKVALGGVTVIPVKGNHIDLFAEPEVAVVAEKIDENCI